MTKEYVVIYIGASATAAGQTLNEMALGGWRVVCSCDKNILVLEREVPDKVESYFSTEVLDEPKSTPTESTRVQTIEYYLDLLDECDEEPDVKLGHLGADNALCKLLDFLGYGEVVKRYNQIRKQ
jgi:hypothetical protein